MKTFREYAEERMKKYQGTVSHSDMKHCLDSINTYGHGLRLMLEGARIYCEAYKNDQGENVSNDHFLAPEIESILRSLHILLSGLGRFDGGTISGFICDLAKEQEIDVN